MSPELYLLPFPFFLVISHSHQDYLWAVPSMCDNLASGKVQAFATSPECLPHTASVMAGHSSPPLA